MIKNNFQSVNDLFGDIADYINKIKPFILVKNKRLDINITDKYLLVEFIGVSEDMQLICVQKDDLFQKQCKSNQEVIDNNFCFKVSFSNYFCAEQLISILKPEFQERYDSVKQEIIDEIHKYLNSDEYLKNACIKINKKLKLFIDNKFVDCKFIRNKKINGKIKFNRLSIYNLIKIYDTI